jgi:Cu-Zn family superoxide dismutase
MAVNISNLRSFHVNFVPHFNETSEFVTGTAQFSQADEKTPIEIMLKLTGFKPDSTHSWHIHQNKVPAGAVNDCGASGGHFNPLKATHGAPENDKTKRHFGDLGNFKADAHGKVDLKVTDKLVTLFGPNSVEDLWVVVHAKADDLGLGGNAGSTIHGNAGRRMTCGAIKVADTSAPGHESAGGAPAENLGSEEDCNDFEEGSILSSAVGTGYFLAFLTAMLI